ncbi:hypothetical protein ATKI12_3242 [Kitasatospora sp. Ki12]
MRLGSGTQPHPVERAVPHVGQCWSGIGRSSSVSGRSGGRFRAAPGGARAQDRA